MLKGLAKWWWQIEEGMPAELAAGRLLLSESPVWTVYPIPLYGIPDQVYATPDGALVPVDTKVRLRDSVSVRDIVQLSVYRTIFAYTDHPLLRGRSIRPYGYLRFSSHGRVRYVRVTLYSIATVMRLSGVYVARARKSKLRNQNQRQQALMPLPPVQRAGRRRPD